MNREAAALLVARMHLIEAYAKGASIQYRLSGYQDGEWIDSRNPTFLGESEYRVKPIEHNWYVVYDGNGHAVGVPRRDRQLAEIDLHTFGMRQEQQAYHIKIFAEVVSGDKS